MSVIELISIAVKPTGHLSYLIFAASLPPFLYLWLKKKKKNGLLQRLFAKLIMKRVMQKNWKRRFGLKDVFGILSILCLILFFVFATGGSGSGLAIPMAIAFLVFLIACLWASKNS